MSHEKTSTAWNDKDAVNHCMGTIGWLPVIMFHASTEMLPQVSKSIDIWSEKDVHDVPSGYSAKVVIRSSK